MEDRGSADPPNVAYLTICRGEGRQTSNTTASYTWTKHDLLAPPRPAPYTIEVRDREGNTDTITTGAPPTMPAAHMSVVAPVMDSVIYQVPPTRLAPALQWQNTSIVPEKTTRIDVYEEGAQSGIWFKKTTDGSTSAVFGIGGTSYTGRTQLLPNHSYVWTVNSGTGTALDLRPGDPISGYHHVIVRDWQELHGRFTVYGAWTDMPAPPVLPGKLAYATESVATLTTSNWGVTGIMGYSIDPLARTWLGPELANYPDWSPDGEKLVYATPSGLFIDDFSGSPPTWIPGTSGSDAKCRWMPDGNQIIFGRCTTGDAFGVPRSYQLWAMDQDGANAHPVMASPSWELSASPSTDGLWVAYESSDGLNPPTVRVVRYDGSEDQAVTATGVAGQDPAYVVTALAQPTWSPDGVALAAVFSANASGLPGLVGIGTVPVSGGPVTPRFISPYIKCCAKPQSPAWSPDGAAVVFSSGHHRPDLDGYDTISAVELWMVNSDGSSTQPIRLTDDYSLDRNISWCGMNTPAGSNVPFRRNDVKLTFETVTAAGMSDIKTLGRPNDPAPPGLQCLDKSYQALITAQYSGQITVEVYYQDADVPAGLQEDSLALLHWENGQWASITSAATDTVNNIITGECTELGDFAVAIAGPPTAEFTAAPVSGSAPLTVQFTDGSTGNPTSWRWSFGDGATSSEQNPSHTYTAAGNYDVTLTAANAGGSSAPATKGGYITVTVSPPVADLSAAPTHGVMPLTVDFVDLSTGNPTAWNWTFGDGGTSAERNPTHTYSAVGTYAVSLTVANAGGGTTTTKAGYIVVTVPPPVAGFSRSPTSGITPLTVQFTDSSIGDPISWLWDLGDGATSDQQNPSHTYTAVGLYTVKLTAANAGGANTCTMAGYVTVLPVPPVAGFSAAPGSGAAPLMVSFKDASTGALTSWFWDFGDGSSSTVQHPTHTYAAVGTHTVSLTASNAGGSTTATDAIAIYRFVGPLKPISADGSAEFRKRPNVPVRFQLTAADGSFVKTADAKLFVALVGPSGAVGDYLPAVSDDYAGNAFIYDTKAHYYEFPLATRDMSGGIWSLRFTVNGAVAEEVRITLIKK